jgi:hypothetical protein
MTTNKTSSFEATLSFKADKSLVKRLRDCDSDVNAMKLLLNALREADDAAIGELLIRPNDDKPRHWERVIGSNTFSPAATRLTSHPYYYCYDMSEAAERPSDDPRADADAWFDDNHGEGVFADYFTVEETKPITDDDLHPLGAGGGNKGTGAQIIPWMDD